MLLSRFSLYCMPLLLLAALTLAAAETAVETQFKVLPPNALRPRVGLTLTREHLDEEWLTRQLERVRDLGAGGVLLAVPAADDAVWGALVRVGLRAKQLGLEVGFQDFALSAEEAAAIPKARKLVWAIGSVTNLGDAAAVPPPAGAEGYQDAARVVVPSGTGTVQLADVTDAKSVSLAGSAPTGGVWRVCRFGSAEIRPAVMDGLDGATLAKHVNRVLFECQSRFKATYGSTVLWYQFAGPDAAERVWPRDLAATFLKRSGLALERCLPAWAGIAGGGEARAEAVRRQVSQLVVELWRERMGRSVNELVHEAGLEAGMRIDQVPVDPEELALYVRRPVLIGREGEAQRASNVRAAGGARAMARIQVVGLLELASLAPSADAALMTFPWKASADQLLSEGATCLLLDIGGAVPGEDVRFRQLQEGCRYAHRCQILLHQGEPVADCLVWSQGVPAALRDYSCDYANGKMLESAAVRDGRIVFGSERAYQTLAVTADVLADKSRERAVRQIIAKGVSVWLVPSGAPEEDALFAPLLGEAARNVVLLKAGAPDGQPAPDFQWGCEKKEMRVRFVHRRTEEHEIYYVVNATDAAAPVTGTFRDAGKGVATRWDPLRGETDLVVQEARRGADGRVTAPFFLGPHDACFIVFDR